MLETQLEKFGAVPISHGNLLSLLADYRRPNDKIAHWLAQGALTPLKRGLYVVGNPWRRQPLCLPLIANHLYGPSCVSLDFALAWHGLIPERVHEITSVCMSRARIFKNFLGDFSYVRLPALLYPIGVTQVVASEQVVFLMASPAKALCDKVLLTRGLRIAGQSSMAQFLFDDLRVDEEAFASLDLNVVQAYAESGHKSQLMQALLKTLKSLSVS